MATPEIQSTKGKSVSSVSLSVPPPSSSVDDEQSDEKKGKSVSHPPARLPSRNASSKYDFVKVKVWLGDNADHYYVLSRFLLSRMLTVTKIPNHVAIKIALELKKLLVDNSLLDVSQSDLEANLFKLMERRNYGEEYINRYRMMTRFHHQRVPLVILVCGTACTGKSTIATQLAQRLNLPNVLQTEMVYELLRTSTDAPLTSTPVWARDFNSPEELITEFCRECRIVRKGLAGDLKKAMKDGKPIIIEGIHLDPSIYLMQEENKDSNPKDEVSGTLVDTTKLAESTPKNIIDASCNASDNDTENTLSIPEMEVTMDERGTFEIKDTNDSRPTLGADISSESLGDTHKDLELQIDNTLKPEKPGSDPIIIPIVLKMAEFDHKALLEEWIGTRTFQDKCIVQDQNKLISNLKTIQDYLCSFESQGMMRVVNISATTFPQTLDRLHSHLLQCIERGISVAASKNSRPEEN